MWDEHKFVCRKVTKGQLAVLDTVVDCEMAKPTVDSQHVSVQRLITS